MFLFDLPNICGGDNLEPLANIPPDLGIDDSVISMHVADHTYLLGPEVEPFTTEDGYSAVTLEDNDGLSVLSDRDGDGWVDHVSTVKFDGSYTAWSWQVANATSTEWEQLSEGSLYGDK